MSSGASTRTRADSQRSTQERGDWREDLKGVASDSSLSNVDLPSRRWGSFVIKGGLAAITVATAGIWASRHFQNDSTNSAVTSNSTNSTQNIDFDFAQLKALKQEFTTRIEAVEKSYEKQAETIAKQQEIIAQQQKVIEAAKAQAQAHQDFSAQLKQLEATTK